MRLKFYERVNIDFLVLGFLLCLVNYPFLFGSILPKHDTLLALEVLHYFYSAFYFDGQLAQWTPYESFGMPGYFLQTHYLTPTNYFVGFLGKLMGVTDVLLIFRWSVFIDNLMFFLGTYLFSSLVFKNRSTVFFVCIGAICSSFWYYQRFFNFYIYSVLPLAFYFIGRFFLEREGKFVWLAGITFVMGLIGNALYFAPVWLLIMVVVLITFVLKDRSVLKPLYSLSLSSGVFFCIFVVIASGFLYLSWHIPDGLRILASGRDEAAGLNDLFSFLICGSELDGPGLLWRYITGWPIGQNSPSPRHDNNFYVGLLPLAFFLWGVIKVRSPWFLAIASTVFIFVGLSCGSLMASVLYNIFPPIRLFRFVCILYGLINLFLILGAGFGFEHFCKSARKINIFSGVIILIVIGELFGASSMNLILSPISGHGISLYAGLSHKLLIIFYSRIGVYILGFLFIGFFLWRFPKAKAKKIMATVLLGCFLFDMFSYRYVVYHDIHSTPSGEQDYSEIFQARPLSYQKIRTKEIADQWQNDVMDFLVSEGSYKGLRYNFLQKDIGWSLLFDFLPEGLFRFLNVRRGKDKGHLKDDLSFNRVIGIKAPKLRFVSKSIWADSQGEVEDLIRKTKNLEEVVILQGEGKDLFFQQQEKTSNSENNAEFSILKYSANEVKIQAEIFSHEGGWLVYADSYFPGWTAEIDGTSVPIAKAYMAFKAVWVEPGRHLVSFKYRAGIKSIISYAIGLVGIVFSIAIILLILRSFIRVQPE